MSRILSLAVLISLSGAASAVNFPAYPVEPVTDLTTTGWTVDRTPFPPRVFSNIGAQNGRDPVLRIGVDAADGQTVRPAPFNVPFYNLQGRKIGFPTVQGPGSAIAGSLFIPAAWNTTNAANTILNRRSELFFELTPLNPASALCPAGPDCFYYGGIGFSNAQQANQLAGGGVPRIRILKKNIATDGYINQTAQYRTNDWNDFCVGFTGTTLEYFMNDQLIFTDTSLTTDAVGQPPVNKFRAFFVTNYNFGQTFDANWSDLQFGTRASLQVTRSNIGNQVTTTVTNTGTTPATGVVVTEQQANGLSVSAVVGACTSLPCNIGNLAAGASASYTAFYAGSAGVSLNSTATVRSDAVDCVRGDNTVTTGVVASLATQLPALSFWSMGLLLLGMLSFGLISARQR